MGITEGSDGVDVERCQRQQKQGDRLTPNEQASSAIVVEIVCPLDVYPARPVIM